MLFSLICVNNVAVTGPKSAAGTYEQDLITCNMSVVLPSSTCTQLVPKALKMLTSIMPVASL